MTDYHVHIGQYEEDYHFAFDVFSALKQKGFSECWYSSTTSCIYCKESLAAKADKEIFDDAPSAQELYESLIEELYDSQKAANEISIIVHSLYWVVPEIVMAGIKIEKTMKENPYEGFKIHTRAQNWDLSQPEIMKIAENVFEYADLKKLRILIHTGVDEIDNPKKFEHLIKKYPNAKIQLAHCKDLDAIDYMLKTYSNVCVDTSASNRKIVELLTEKHGTERIIFGSDFPILK